MEEEKDRTPKFGTEIISEAIIKEQFDKTPKFGTEIISEPVIKEEIDKTTKSELEKISESIKKEEIDKTPKSGSEKISDPTNRNMLLQLVSWLRLFNWEKGYIRLAVVLSVIGVLWGLAVGSFYGFSYQHYSDFLEPVILGLVVLWVVVPSVLWVVVPLLVYVIKWIVRGFTDKD